MSWTFFSHWHLRSRQVFRGRKRRSLDIIGRWGKGLAWVMGVRVVERNRRQGPMGDVVVANHMGFLDVPVLLSYYPAVFIIKMELRRVFYFGKALARGGHVFVERGSSSSRRSARAGVSEVLEQGDRIIVFPEGGASCEKERRPFKPFCFFEAARLGKSVELCIIDYQPDRRQLRWDVNRKMVPQLMEIIGRRRTDVSVEFFPAEVPDDPEAVAQRYHDLVEQRLADYDRERGLGRDEPEPREEERAA